MSWDWDKLKKQQQEKGETTKKRSRYPRALRRDQAENGQKKKGERQLNQGML